MSHFHLILALSIPSAGIVFQRAESPLIQPAFLPGAPLRKEFFYVQATHS